MTRSLVLAILLLCGLAAQAHPVVDGGLLGVDEKALKQLFPDVSRLARPVLGPHRTRGTWRLDNTPLADLSLATTFFFKSRQLMRIEQQTVLGQTICPAVMPGQPWFAELQTRYGDGLLANSTNALGLPQQSALWVAQNSDVSIYLTQQTAQCEVLLVYQPHAEKDASEL
jgi:hypothetical protein